MTSARLKFAHCLRPAIPVVSSVLANDADDAAKSASQFLDAGQTMAVKIFSREMQHKSDIGGARGPHKEELRRRMHRPVPEQGKSVRKRILIPPCGGSNPPASASY